MRAAAAVLRSFRPHIVHGAVFEGVITAVLAGKLARAPVIVTEEIISPVDRSFSGHLYFRLLTGMSDYVIAISRGVERYLTERLRLPRSKVRLIYNGVTAPPPASPDELRSIREQFGLARGAPVLGTVSRLAAPSSHPPDSHKRIADALAAMRQVLAYEPKSRLLIVGDGPDRAFLEQRAKTEGLGYAAVFAGFQPRTRPFLECMDVQLLPSRAEGLPLVLVEGMFASRPIIATDVPGSNEVVVDGETGFLVPLGNHHALSRRACELLADEGLRRRMGEAGRRRAEALFSEERYVAEIAAFYEEAATKASRRVRA
jgi:glycosyltransferase involved in cell wall biosynthesis